MLELIFTLMEMDFTVYFRTINYQVEAKKYINYDCHVALYLELPQELYVNIDELADLQRFTNMRACAVGETNVELFAEEAKPQSVSFCTALNFDATTLNLTIHQRYQRAKEKEDYANVILPFPKLLLGCKKRIKEYQVSLIDLCDSCVGFAIKWREIPYQTETKNYMWIIPIGELTHRSYVTYITLFTSVIGTLIILKALFSVNPTDHVKNN
ncbi:phosphatidylinositol-glycan biosynthesis class X protein isoform X2 [Cotesia typhae]|uniref:phosphatidylinositol-glycan biosynthesis class X protein isoform X2 n=1 Tax=Cotesia typhae TaxID=2053667 RepID=UPI003D6903F4